MKFTKLVGFNALKLYVSVVCLYVFTFVMGDAAFSAGEVSETGSAGMSFLRITPSAYITSLGGGATAYATGPSSLWSNPALIALPVPHSTEKDEENKRSVQFTHIEWIEGIKQEFASFSSNSKIGHFGLGVQIFDSGDIELRGLYPSSKPLGTYSIKNAAISLCYAQQLYNTISLGVAFKKLYEKVSMETADGYAVDLGVSVQTPFDGFSVACAARNNGRMGRLKNERTKLPSDVSFGCFYHGMLPGIRRSFIVVGDFFIPKYGDSGARLGMEMEPLNSFFLRAGYRSDSDIQDVSFGIGFTVRAFTVDVSYTPMKEGFDNALRFTLGIAGF